LGKTLRERRERLGLTASQVAAATKMKVQTLEAIEREDFSKIAAPIYGKGFIKLYAEQLGLDWRPLVEEYYDILGQTMTPSLVAAGPQKPADAEPAHLPDDSHMRVVSKAEAETPPKAPAAHPERELDLFSPPAREESAAEPPPAGPKEPESTGSDSLFEEPATSAPKGFGRWFFRLDAFLSGLDIWRSPIRAAALVLGLVLILIFVVSALSRCFTSSRMSGAAESPRSELQVVVQPPEPYFE
jgi:transcriptional regulator with XRE-family HTH domain